MLRKDFYMPWNDMRAAFMTSPHEIEESRIMRLDFEKLTDIGRKGFSVLPVVVQDVQNLQVLLIAYVNHEALRLSLQERRAVFFSTSRGEIWRKGATSGDFLDLVEIRVNCEQNSLLYLVRKSGYGSCHTRDAAGKTRSSCYYRRVHGDDLLEFF